MAVVPGSDVGTSAAPQFTGAVLAGGRSRRMGRDKALIELGDGRPLATIAATALRDAGADPVLIVGGGAGPTMVGLTVVADRYPDEGPLGGVLTALGAVDAIDPHGDDIVVVLTCDLPAVTAAEVAALVAALVGAPGADVAAPVVDDRPQFLTAAYRGRAATVLGAAFDAGERAVRRAAAPLELVAVVGLDPHRLADVDTPDDLARHLAGR